ncbi:MAG: hypothetical protein ACJATI_004480, partial [Halioglobus sp.]
MNAQIVWSKTWNAGDTDYTNRIKSSHLINDTLYYTTFNACNVDGQFFNECMSIGKMDKQGGIIKEVLLEEIRISEQGQIPWRVKNDVIILAEGSAKSEPANYKIHTLSKYDLELLNTVEYQLDYPTDQLFITGFEEYNDYYILSGITQVKDTSIYPDILVWIDKSTKEVDTILEYPFEKEAVIPRLLFVGQDRLLTYYFSGTRVGNDGFGGRGFVKLDSNKTIVFHYLDKIHFSTNHQYEHSGLLMKNGKMIYKQRYNGSEQPWPGTWMSDFDILCIDDDGQIEWRFNKPGSSYTGAYLQFDGTKNILHMTETADGDILACGTTNWHFNYPTIFEYNWTTDTLPPFPDSLETYEAPYILKLDGETGELIWQFAIIE